MKLTPWFPVKVKPARDGVYLVKCSPFGEDSYSFFDGRRFNSVYSGAEWAFDERAIQGVGFMVSEWRGLAKEPK